VSWSRRRRAAIVLAAVCLAAAAVSGMRGLKFDTDILSLLPRDGRAVPAFRAFVQSFGGTDDLFVVFTAPPDRDIREYDSQIDLWIVRLRTAPEIARLDTGRVDRSRDMTWLGDRRLLLLEDDKLQEALARFQGEALGASLRSRRALLTVPSPAVAEMVRHDPLGIYDLLRDPSGTVQAGLNLGVVEGGYISSDSRSRLIVAKPLRPPFETAFSRALMARLDAIHADLGTTAKTGDEDLPPLEVQFAGGHRIAVETESVIRRESILNAAGSLALILPLLFLVFRSPWLVAIGAIPSGLSLLVTLGVLGTTGATLSAAATASSAMLFGLGVDGVVLLYVAYTFALRAGTAPEAAIDGLGGPASSMLLGMWTTAATFYGLKFVDFPSLEQLGTLVGHSMVLCGILTLILVPALLPLRRSLRSPRSLAMPRFAEWVHRRRGSILLAALVLTLGLGASATRLRVNPSLERLRAVTPGATLLQRIGPKFGLPEDVYVVVASGADLEELLVSNERLRAGLRRALPGLQIQAASTLLPSQHAQAQRQRLVVSSGISAAVVARSLTAAEAVEGFRPGSFDPFKERLPALLDPSNRLTFDGYTSQGLGDVVRRFVSRDGARWLVASYVFPSSPDQVAALEQRVRELDASATLTGLPVVNRELADRFLPEFAKGLAIGTLVVIALVFIAFRSWRLSLLSLMPTAFGIIWAAGVLALAGIPLDLFALFAVVTFVGIGVDYGVHMVHRYRERGDSRRAVEELSPVILVAGAITLLGYGTLITSSYPPLRSIGLVSSISVLMLAGASLFVLPAILVWQSPQTTSGPSQVKAPRRWTLHGLNNGLIFSATYHGVRNLPRPISYGIAYAGTWLAWRAMGSTREALAENLRALFPHEDQATLDRRALLTLRSYAFDVIDFLRALGASSDETDRMFLRAAEHPILDELLSRKRGIILITGHYGNWEVGSTLLRQALDMPLTIVAMAEPSPTVNRIRREIRESLGADTIEVRQAFETALQIRRCLAENQIVAILVDRHYGRDRVPVKLLGRDAWFLRTPFLMAHATGAPLLPCFIERVEPGRFKTGLAAPVIVATDIPRDEAIERAAQTVADALSARIHEHPELWYHFYNYWEAQKDNYDGLA
jgi:predicted exporter/lauroyl/myristoyl acyltransferase